MNRTLVALFIAAGISAPAAALQAEDTIVVTGSRIERYEDDLVPHIHLIRQADAISVRLRVVCDTRDRGQRVRELRDTLRNLIQTSNRDQSVDVGVLIEQSEFGNEVIVDFDESMVETIQASAGYGRTDVSQVTIMATTPIRDTDTVDLAADRISDFVNAIRVVGRTEVLNTGDWVLTVTGGPARYRDEIISAISADARETAAVFGDEFAISVSGLESPVRWQQVSALELSLYINYDLTVESTD